MPEPAVSVVTPPAGQLVIHEAPIQNRGAVTEPAGVTAMLSATKLVTPSPPDFNCDTEPTLSGAETFPLGGPCVGPVHAEM